MNPLLFVFRNVIHDVLNHKTSLKPVQFSTTIKQFYICFIKETWNVNSRLLNTITMYKKIIITFLKILNLTALAVPRLKVHI